MNLKTVTEANSGQIHGLVNSVAYFGSKGITAEKEDWNKSFSVNVVGYANMVQACYKYMRKMPGHIHTASVSGHRCQPTRYKSIKYHDKLMDGHIPQCNYIVATIALDIANCSIC